jgi:fructosamine-3-kinase
MMTLEDALRRAVGAATGSEVRAMAVVRGGDVAASFRAELDTGLRLFAKTHPSPPPGFFTTEAASLRWLRKAEAAVPEVVAVSDGSDDAPAFLILEWIQEGRPRAMTERDFGEALARVHAAGAPCFGREDRRTTGSRRLPNDPSPDWATFYASCRLLPLARLAADSGALPSPTITRLEHIAATLDRFEDGAPPSRLHGDLWAGNRLVDVDGRSWMIDPASHGGHREFDLAMMRLFGGFGADCFAAYSDQYPLEPGWEDRISLHQIAPLVVHAIKFGGSYVAAAVAAIDRY